MTEREFAEIVDSTKGVVLSAIEKNISERFYHSIDDIVQETYIRAYRSLIKKKFMGDSSISTWLFSIAKNETLRMNKRLSREEEKVKKSVLKFKTKQDNNENVNNRVEELHYAIDSLPEKQRSVMELISRGFTETQIAEKLHIKKGTVKSRTYRGREMLRNILK